MIRSLDKGNSHRFVMLQAFQSGNWKIAFFSHANISNRIYLPKTPSYKRFLVFKCGNVRVEFDHAIEKRQWIWDVIGPRRIGFLYVIPLRQRT